MDHYLTKKKLDELKEELDKCKNVKRKEVAKRLKRAKELGDLSENAEYHAAKDEQGMNESRVIEIEAILKQAIVVEKDKKSGVVQVGSDVVIKNGGGEKEFTIVGSNEADPTSGMISNESPFGVALLGKKKGEKALIKTPRGEIEYTIVKVK